MVGRKEKTLGWEVINYETNFSPTKKMSPIRLILGMVALFGWKARRMDMKSAFLNGYLVK